MDEQQSKINNESMIYDSENHQVQKMETLNSSLKMQETCSSKFKRKLQEITDKAANFLQCTRIFPQQRVQQLKNKSQCLSEISNGRSLLSNVLEKSEKKPSKHQQQQEAQFGLLNEKQTNLRSYTMKNVLKFQKRYSQDFNMSYSQRRKIFGYTFEEITQAREKEWQQKQKNLWSEFKRLIFCYGGAYEEEIDESITKAERENESQIQPNLKKIKDKNSQKGKRNQYQNVLFTTKFDQIQTPPAEISAKNPRRKVRSKINIVNEIGEVSSVEVKKNKAQGLISESFYGGKNKAEIDLKPQKQYRYTSQLTKESQDEKSKHKQENSNMFQSNVNPNGIDYDNIFYTKNKQIYDKEESIIDDANNQKLRKNSFSQKSLKKALDSAPQIRNYAKKINHLPEFQEASQTFHLNQDKINLQSRTANKAAKSKVKRAQLVNAEKYDVESYEKAQNFTLHAEIQKQKTSNKVQKDEIFVNQHTESIMVVSSKSSRNQTQRNEQTNSHYQTQLKIKKNSSAAKKKSYSQVQQLQTHTKEVKNKNNTPGEIIDSKTLPNSIHNSDEQALGSRKKKKKEKAKFMVIQNCQIEQQIQFDDL